MSDTASNPSEWTVRLPLPARGCAVQRDLPFSSEPGDGRSLDIYRPANEPRPTGAIIIVSGYPLAGLQLHVPSTAVAGEG